MLKDKIHRIIVLIPGKNARGGIANYYNALFNHLPSNYLGIERGSRNWPDQQNNLGTFYRLIKDFWEFIKCARINQTKCLVLNTAFYRRSLIREVFYIILAKYFCLKIVVFFRGWDTYYVNNLKFYDKLILRMIFTAEIIMDLSSENTAALKSLGYNGRVILETTLYDVSLLEGFNLQSTVNERYNSMEKNLLYLGRIEKSKGVYELVDTFQSLKESLKDFSLIIAGDGSELLNLKDYVTSRDISGVIFTGHVSGRKKAELFQNAFSYIFMSRFEGLPNSVLEAMAFGLPVVSTNVGGLSTFFDSSNGYLLDVIEHELIVDYYRNLRNNHELYQSISANNHFVAKNNFASDKVAIRFQTVINELI